MFRALFEAAMGVGVILLLFGGGHLIGTNPSDWSDYSRTGHWYHSNLAIAGLIVTAVGYIGWRSTRAE